MVLTMLPVQVFAAAGAGKNAEPTGAASVQTLTLPVVPEGGLRDQWGRLCP